MAKRGRQPGIKLPEEHRDKIKNSNILTYLIDHVEGKREMSQTQVSAGVALLKKTLPDLSTVDGRLTADINGTLHHKIEQLIVDTPNRSASGVQAASDT